MDDRRLTDRIRTSETASIQFGKQTGNYSCEVEVNDLASRGAGLYKPGSAILPLTFELAIGNVRRRCRMVWRNGNFFGVTFEDQDPKILNKPETTESDVTVGAVTPSIPDEPLLVADVIRQVGEFTLDNSEHSAISGADFRFSIGVAVVAALPALISLGAYVAMAVVLRAG
jgi:hypothetical protein